MLGRYIWPQPLPPNLQNYGMVSGTSHHPAWMHPTGVLKNRQTYKFLGNQFPDFHFENKVKLLDGTFG